MTHYRGVLFEETHYYPFGLIQAGISSKAAGIIPNKKKYQQYELNTDFDLNWNESFYRTHDPQLGRFCQLDPKAVDEISLYASMDDNPILNTDFLGDLTHIYTANGDEIGAINTQNGNYATIVDGDAAKLATLTIFLIQKFNIKDEKILAFLENAIRSEGENYDIASFEKFSDNNKTKTKYALGFEVGDLSNVVFTDVKTKNSYGLKDTHAELYGNLIVEGNVVKVGYGTTTSYSLTSGIPGDLPDIPNKSSYIHDHPDGGNGTTIKYDVLTRDGTGKVKGKLYNQTGWIGGGPSPEDKGYSGQFKYRSVVVDKNHIYLIKGDNNVITINRN